MYLATYFLRQLKSAYDLPPFKIILPYLDF